MYVLHATEKLRTRMRAPLIASPDASSTALGAWYATAVMWRPQLALFVNEVTLLPMFASLSPARTLPQTFPDLLAEVLRAHGVASRFVDDELVQMRECQVAKTANRSVVGVMNDFVRLAEAYVESEPSLSLPWLSAQLASTPCSPLYRSHISPDRALAALVT